MRLALPALPRLTGPLARVAATARALRPQRRARPAPPKLAAYTGGSKVRRFRRTWIAALILLCAIYGFVFAIFSNFLLLQVLAPLVLPLLLVLWVLPETGRPPDLLLERLLIAFMIQLLCWPDYLALTLPGMPWITATRLIGLPMMLMMLVCLSVSKDFRARIGLVLSTEPWMLKLFLAYIATLIVTMPLATSIVGVVNRVFVAQIGWTTVFFASCYTFARPGRALLMARLLWPITLLTLAIGIYEIQYGRLPWADHIPWFLAVQDEQVIRLLAGTARAATGAYRVQSKFGNSLGLGEFLALATPFIIHGTFTTRNQMVRLLGLLMLPLIFLVVIRTDSRLAAVGFLMSLMLYLLVWAALRWRNDERSLFGPAIVMAYPALFAGFVAATFFVNRLTLMVWGGGAQQASTDSRKLQWTMGIPKVLKNPFGNGVGESGSVLDFVSPSGVVTVDSYYLTILLDQGVLGCITFIAMFVLAIKLAGGTAIKTRDPEILLLMPAAIAFANFLLSKAVFSQTENHPMAFMLLGMTMALVWRQRQQAAVAAPALRRGGLYQMG